MKHYLILQYCKLRPKMSKFSEAMHQEGDRACFKYQTSSFWTLSESCHHCALSCWCTSLPPPCQYSMYKFKCSESRDCVLVAGRHMTLLSLEYTVARPRVPPKAPGISGQEHLIQTSPLGLPHLWNGSRNGLLVGLCGRFEWRFCGLLCICLAGDYIAELLMPHCMSYGPTREKLPT